MQRQGGVVRDVVVGRVARGHDRGPAEQAQDVAPAVVRIAKALHGQKGEQRADTAGQHVQGRGSRGRQQAGDVVNMVEHHPDGGKQLELKGIAGWFHRFLLGF